MNPRDLIERFENEFELNPTQHWKTFHFKKIWAHAQKPYRMTVIWGKGELTINYSWSCQDKINLDYGAVYLINRFGEFREFETLGRFEFDCFDPHFENGHDPYRISYCFLSGSPFRLSDEGKPAEKVEELKAK